MVDTAEEANMNDKPENGCAAGDASSTSDAYAPASGGGVAPAAGGSNGGGASSLNGGETGTIQYNGEIAPQDSDRDKIHIADEVIIQIITIAAGRIEGAAIPSVSVGDGIAGFLGMKGASRGIRIESDDKSVTVDISIAVEYGLKINEIAKSMQDAVRADLMEMTGLNVVNVNVHVVSVNTKEPPAGKASKAVKQQKETGSESPDPET